MATEREITKNMLKALRKGADEKARLVEEEFKKMAESTENDTYLSRMKILMEEAVDASKKKALNEVVENSHQRRIAITKNTPQFGDVRVSQEDVLRKTVGESIELGSDALVYYPDADDITLTGKVNSLNLSFQFRYNDPSGDGCFVWAEGLQLTDANARTIGKIRDAFVNWKNSILQDGDLMDKLKKASAHAD